MPVIVEQVLEQLKNLPPDVDNPILAIGSAVVLSAAAAWSIHRDINGAKEDYADTARDFDGGNAQVLQKVIKTTKEDAPATEKVYSIWYRVGHRALIASGLAIVGASLLSQPQVETTTHTNKGAEVAVLDTSYSMIDTKLDGKITTFEAAQQAIQNSKFNGELAVVQFGATAQTTIPLGSKSNSEIAALGSSANVNAIDPNGGDVPDAIKEALSDLPSVKGNPNKRSGEILVYSDGTVQQTNGQTPANTLASQEAIAKKEGVTVKFIVPGTTAEQYYISNADGTTGPYPDGVSPQTFNVFGSKNVIPTGKSIKAMTDITNSSVNSLVGTVESKSIWYPPYILGVIAIGAGMYIDGKRIRNKRS